MRTSQFLIPTKVTSRRGPDHLSEDALSSRTLQASSEQADGSAATSETEDEIRGLLEPLDTSKEVVSRNDLVARLGDLYFAGDGTAIKEPDYQMAAKLYLRAGARDKFMHAMYLMYQGIGHRFSAQEIAALYKAAGELGQLQDLAKHYATVAAAQDPADCRNAIEFLAAAGDVDGLVQLGDMLVRARAGEPGGFTLEAYKRAKADAKIIELGDKLLKEKKLVAAFQAYRAVTGKLPEQTVRKLVDLANRLTSAGSYRQNQEAMEALTIAKAKNELIALGEQMASTGVYLYAIRAFAAAGAADKLISLSETLANVARSSVQSNVKSDATHYRQEAIATATKLITEA